MKVAAFGEIMLRFSPLGYKRFVQSDSFGVTFGGAEANVCVALSNWGQESVYITSVPKHDIGQMAVNSLRKYGVDISRICRQGQRLGTYYCEKGASQRPSQVIYDRADSAFALSSFDDYNWQDVFTECKWLHITGITPALNELMRDNVERIMALAKQYDVKVSFDLNYRSKLWTKEEAGCAIKKLLPYVDVLIANENQITEILGIKSESIIVQNDDYSFEMNMYMAHMLRELYGIDIVALTSRRTKSANINTFRAMLSNSDENNCFSQEYTIDMVDRVGSGDSFAAGIIFALINGYSTQYSVDFAVASAVLNHSVEGDFNLVSKEEVESLMKNRSARVQR